jgi:protein lin-9 homolog
MNQGVTRQRCQEIGHNLRNLLKLPKAHKWAYYEWFYGNIDSSLFLEKNDFEICLEETFRGLKTRQLRRPEWAKIRRLIGKPRRCSEAFFAEERLALNAKRNKIRQLHLQRVVDVNQFRDLPENIPLGLVIGAKVTALIRKPQDGLFTGTVDAVDTTNGCYRITFDRPGIGTHSVPDYEVLSNDPPEFIALSSFQSKVRPRMPMHASPRFLQLLGNQVAQALGEGDTIPNDPASPIGAIGKTETSYYQQTANNTINSMGEEGTLGGFPIKFLGLLVRLSKILSVKKKKIFELKSLNTEAERMRSLQEPINHEFQKQYATTILELEKLNSDLNDNLRAVQQYSAEISPSHNLHQYDGPNVFKRKYFCQAKEIVERSLANTSLNSEKTIDIISHLLSLMLHLKNFVDVEVSSYELQALSDSLRDCKQMIDPSNHSTFETKVEVPINYIQSNLSHLGNLGAFAESFVDSYL